MAVVAIKELTNAALGRAQILTILRPFQRVGDLFPLFPSRDLGEPRQFEEKIRVCSLHYIIG
jgi:hypothetical protein